MPKQHSSMLLCILALMPMAVAMPFALDMYIPTLPSIIHDLHVSDAAMQLTLNLFMLFASISVLIIGPITDSVGRRRATLLCASAFALGCLMSGLAHSFTWLLIGRFIQAFGSCGLMVVCLSVARDMYSGNKLAKAFSIINGIISFSPLLAPFIGSHIDLLFGWHATFFALLLLCALSIVCYFPVLPETCPPHQRRPIPKALLKTYLALFKNPLFFIYTLSSAGGMIFLFSFCALSPVILIQELHVPEAHYGFYFAFMGVSILAGSLIAAKYVERVGLFKMTVIGLILSLTGGLLMLTWYCISGLSVLGFVAPMLLIGTGATLMIGSGSAGSLEPYPHHAGTASAAGGAFRLLLCSVVGLIISAFTHTPLPLVYTVLLVSIGCLILFKLYKTTLNISFDDNTH